MDKPELCAHCGKEKVYGEGAGWVCPDSSANERPVS